VNELFYLPPECARGEFVSFSHHESVHITKSCRKVKGDKIRVTDGRGSLMTVRITGAGKRVEGEVTERHRVASEMISVDVGVGISKRERMSWLVEKGTEVGMTSLTPLITSWSVSQRHRDEWEGHTARWKRVAISALKQSHRSYLPEIRSPNTIDQFMDKARAARYDLKILLDHGEGSVPVLNLVKKGMKRFLMMVGPEGGFSESEIARITGEGFLQARLLDRRLRFETAGIAALAIIFASTGGQESR
jgi:16S rRNA (uracil1498-N3)-methyltransferase